MAEPAERQGEPYCGNCGYALTGATDSPRCPECGKPLVEVLMRPIFEPRSGKRWASRTRIFGLPLVHIAIGPRDDERKGRARGFIAIGDLATGVIALGGQARGLVAIGGTAIGGFSAGGLSIGLFTSLGGFAIGGLAAGGFALGALAQGGGAVGYIAQGGLAIGHYARGGGVFGTHLIGPGVTPSTEAHAMFDNLAWLFGGPGFGLHAMLTALVAAVTPMLAVLFVCGLIALLAFGRGKGAENDAAT